MCPKHNEIDWSALTDKEFAKQIAILTKARRKLFEKSVAELNNDEMMACIKAGRFDKTK